jgi:predicted PurR-regulated permease PerM
MVQSGERGGDFLVWFEIHPTVSIVAFALGLMILVIAYFAGGKENFAKLWASILIALVISVLSMPLFIKFGRFFGLLKSKIGEIFVLLLLMIFISALAGHIYEIITVSAREARPD